MTEDVGAEAGVGAMAVVEAWGTDDSIERAGDGVEVPTVAPSPVGIEELVDAVDLVRDQLETLAAESHTVNERAAARERVIDHLRDEVERLRDVERGGRLRPLVVDLQRLRIDLVSERGRTEEDVPAERARAMLDFYADTVAQLLERVGAVPSTPQAGDRFTPGPHHPVRTVDVSGPEQHGTVVDVLGEGYVEAETGRVLAPARVLVGRFIERGDSHV